MGPDATTDRNQKIKERLNHTRQLDVLIGDWWYGVISRWEDIRLTIEFPGDTPSDLGPVTDNDVSWQGKPVMNWFTKEFVTTCRDYTRYGKPMSIILTFDHVTPLAIRG